MSMTRRLLMGPLCPVRAAGEPETAVLSILTRGRR
jgi:hypothetical protein